MGGEHVCCCARQRNNYQSRRDSRTDHSPQTCNQARLLFFWFLCNSQLTEHLLSIQAPSNSDLSGYFYTAFEDTCQTSPDGQDMTDSPHIPPSCCCQWAWVFCLPCLSPAWVHMHLMEISKTQQRLFICLEFIECVLLCFYESHWKQAYTSSGLVSTTELQ